MGTITSGIGLISGMNISSIVSQLMAIEARPRDLLTSQVNKLDTVKTAWATLSANLLAIKSAAAGLDETQTFQQVSASSSNSSVLTASATAGAVAGDYIFTPARLATSHQVVSTGRPDSNTTPVGAGTLTIDLGHGNLDQATSLAFLNGQTGVPRGKIQVTDRTGASATIDLTTATNVQDVLDAINKSSAIAVTASVSGDSIVLTDTSGSTSAHLAVAEVDSGGTAAGLGLLGSAADSVLTGQDVVSVNANTRLSGLNNGNGVRTLGGGTDLNITLEDGTGLAVDLSGAGTLGDVLNSINAATSNGGKLVASIAPGGDHLTLTDMTGGLVGPLTVAAYGASKAALDLGLLGSDGDGNHVLQGQRLTAGLNSVLLRNLNGGRGVAAGSIAVQDRGTGSAVVDLSSAQTVQDVIDQINGTVGVSVHAALNSVGDGIDLTDTSGQTARNFQVSESGGTTAHDLNLLHDAADGGVNSGQLDFRYVSENSLLADLGVAAGKFVITDSAGHRATVDLTQSTDRTLGQAIQEINTRGLGVTASINAAGNGLLLTDTAGGAGRLSVADSGSTTAADLGIAGTDSDGDQKIEGSQRITVTVGAGDTLQTLASKISAAGDRVSAAVINDGTSLNPYRLVITSKVSGQAGRMIIDSGAVPVSFATMSKPQDALLFLGDPTNASSIAVTSPSNTVSNVIDGVTLNLLGTSSSSVAVSVASSADSAVSQFKNFVSAFNATVSKINSLTAYDTKTNTAGPLEGDATAMRIHDQLFAMVTGSVAGASGKFSRLSQVGVSVTGDGTQIALDETKFRAAYAADPAGVTSLFTQASTGVGDRIDKVLTGLTDAFTGTIQRQVDSIDTQEGQLNDRIAQMNELLTSKQARLTEQFTAMESALAQLQSQSSALTSLSLLTGDTSSSSSTSMFSSG